MTQKTNQNPWTMDVRVRERNLKSGSLTEKDLEKFLGALPDLADQAEAFGTSQPALAQPQVAVSEPSSVDDVADEEEDEQDEEQVEAQPVQAAEPAPAVEPPPAPTGNEGDGQL